MKSSTHFSLHLIGFGTKILRFFFLVLLIWNDYILEPNYKILFITSKTFLWPFLFQIRNLAPHLRFVFECFLLVEISQKSKISLNYFWGVSKRLFLTNFDQTCFLNTIGNWSPKWNIGPILHNIAAKMSFYCYQRYWGGPPKFWSSVLFYGTPTIMFYSFFKKEFSETWGLCCSMGPNFSRKICQKFDRFS